LSDPRKRPRGKSKKPPGLLRTRVTYTAGGKCETTEGGGVKGGEVVEHRGGNKRFTAVNNPV